MARSLVEIAGSACCGIIDTIGVVIEILQQILGEEMCLSERKYILGHYENILHITKGSIE